MSEFDSAWWKWFWAIQHAASLKAQLTATGTNRSGDPFVSVGSEYHPNRHCFVATATEVSPIATVWSLRFGDVVQNVRASLDHVAWAVYQRGASGGKLPGGKENAIQFLYACTPDEWRKRHRDRFPGGLASDLDIIRRYQPYAMREKLRRSYSLTHLARLSNEDKHRALHFMVARTAATDYKVRDVADCVVTRIVPTPKPVPIEIGTELARVYVRRTGPNPYLEVYGQAVSSMAIDNQLSVDAWCVQVVEVVRRLLMEFSQPPADLLRILDSE